MYQRILATRNPAWAKLGLAKVALRQGDSATAEKAMLDIINAHLRYLPVYNQLSDFYLSEERYGDALDIIEQAIKITPHSIKRLQRAGQVAYSLGDAVKAGDYFGRALRHAGGRAVELDYRTIFHLALLQFEAGQTPDASSLVKQMTAKQKDDPLAQDSRRGEWYAQMAIATESIARREPLAAVDVLRKLAGHSGDPDFNFEIAVDYLAVIDRLYTEDIGSTLAEWVQPLAYRFASSRQAQELLAARVSRRTRLVALIERASTEISDITESAARSLVEGNAHAAAEQLAQEGLKYRNNRLLAAAANAAAKSFQQTGNADDRQQAEVCLASMCPPDESLTLRLRQFLNAEPAT
jgi:Tfp pilus assembly protein PilF